MTTTRLPVAAHDGTQIPAIQVQARATLPTRHGAFETLAYVSDGDPTPHLALVLGDPAGHDVLVRVHSECLTGERLTAL